MNNTVLTGLLPLADLSTGAVSPLVVSETVRVSEKTMSPVPNKAKKTPGPTLLSLSLFPPASVKSPLPPSAQIEEKPVAEVDQHTTDEHPQDAFQHP
ncbi:hypothetical protein BH20VER2_BH20VER2_08060 [soil metagenome]